MFLALFLWQTFGARVALWRSGDRLGRPDSPSRGASGLLCGTGGSRLCCLRAREKPHAGPSEVGRCPLLCSTLLSSVFFFLKRVNNIDRIPPEPRRRGASRLPSLHPLAGHFHRKTIIVLCTLYASTCRCSSSPADETCVETPK